MQENPLRFALVIFIFFALSVGNQSWAQHILLDDFEAGSIRIGHPSGTGQGGDTRLLWSQYEGEGDRGEAMITSEEAHDGSRSLKVTLTNSSGARDGAAAVYLQFFPHNNGTWFNMREFTQPSSQWQMDTFNRLRLWVKVSPGTTKFTGGRINTHFGTYVRASNGSRSSAESGGGHYYHSFNIGYTGEWHQIIVDMHPNHRRGGNGGTEWGDLPYPTGESGFNYFDALTRFYFDMHHQECMSYPCTFYFDGLELYRETRQENTAQVYSLNGVYVPSTNEIIVGWMRNKDENSLKHDVRYAFQDIHQVGWNTATPAPNGVVQPLGWQGYNGMTWSTRSVDVSGESVIYVAIKPQNASLFRQIAIPLIPAGGPELVPLQPPSNLRVISAQ